IADAMKADGIKPTSRAVRERLGNTGSMGTINKLLQHWKAGQERQATASLTLPPALQKAVLDFMDQELAAARATLEA
ncbi:DNA-binding protein, partial [Bacillus sp. SIMBA_006]|uniref:DNA-binding protein n=1 Tax=Bacillus sp. SIMBA_006 TaxID=3085755 RepID=UPI003978C2A5